MAGRKDHDKEHGHLTAQACHLQRVAHLLDLEPEK